MVTEVAFLNRNPASLHAQVSYVQPSSVTPLPGVEINITEIGNFSNAAASVLGQDADHVLEIEGLGKGKRSLGPVFVALALVLHLACWACC